MSKKVKLIHPILGFQNWTIKVPIVFGVFFSSLTVDAIIFHELWQIPCPRSGFACRSRDNHEMRHQRRWEFTKKPRLGQDFWAIRGNVKPEIPCFFVCFCWVSTFQLSTAVNPGIAVRHPQPLQPQLLPRHVAPAHREPPEPPGRVLHQRMFET